MPAIIGQVEINEILFGEETFEPSYEPTHFRRNNDNDNNNDSIENWLIPLVGIVGAFFVVGVFIFLCSYSSFQGDSYRNLSDAES